MTIHYSRLRKRRRITPCLSTFAALSSENCLYRVQGGGNFSHEVCHVPPEFKIHFMRICDVREFADSRESLSARKIVDGNGNIYSSSFDSSYRGNRGKKPIKLYITM